MRLVHIINMYYQMIIRNIHLYNLMLIFMIDKVYFLQDI